MDLYLFCIPWYRSFVFSMNEFIHYINIRSENDLVKIVKFWSNVVYQWMKNSFYQFCHVLVQSKVNNLKSRNNFSDLDTERRLGSV